LSLCCGGINKHHPLAWAAGNTLCATHCCTVGVWWGCFGFCGVVQKEENFMHMPWSVAKKKTINDVALAMVSCNEGWHPEVVKKESNDAAKQKKKTINQCIRKLLKNNQTMQPNKKTINQCDKMLLFAYYVASGCQGICCSRSNKSYSGN